MNATGKRLEVVFERLLFASRWILAPFYLGMVFALLAILIVFVRELATELSHIIQFDAEQVILLALSRIDPSLTGTAAPHTDKPRHPSKSALTVATASRSLRATGP